MSPPSFLAWLQSLKYTAKEEGVICGAQRKPTLGSLKTWNMSVTQSSRLKKINLKLGLFNKETIQKIVLDIYPPPRIYISPKKVPFV